ncbi:MAG TPA: PASTA domain-containing protein [Candidatus Hydrogenedentes bacterium]|nr:PASTA domain-containing protein [Candidatus Hydrogenedentota bacterium]
MAESTQDTAGSLQDKPARRRLGRVLLDALAEGILNLVFFLFRFVFWCVRWSFATVFFVVVMAGAGYYVFNQVLEGGEYVRVPDITGQDVTNASYLLAEQGLEMGKIEEMPDEGIPKGRVVAQRPAAGKVVRSGRKIYPTVSSGSQTVPAPNFLRRALRDACEELDQSQFRLGTVARIPHTAPRGTIIAQDPAPPMTMPAGGAISFLVSDSPERLTYLMPDIVDKPVDEVLRTLSPMGVLPVPKRVDEPGARLDTVLDQDPAPGTLIHEGDTVFYFVRPSGEVALPDARRRVEVTYTVPPWPGPCEVRIDTIDRNGVRQTVFPQVSDYVNGAPPMLVTGQSITLPIWFVGKMTVEVLLDGNRVRTYLYEGDGEPEIKSFELSRASGTVPS